MDTLEDVRLDIGDTFGFPFLLLLSASISFFLFLYFFAERLWAIDSFPEVTSKREWLS